MELNKSLKGPLARICMVGLPSPAPASPSQLIDFEDLQKQDWFKEVLKKDSSELLKGKYNHPLKKLLD
jgi:hypothetical protein